MDIAAEIAAIAKNPSNAVQPLHRRIGRAEDAGGEKQAKNLAAAKIIKKGVYGFFLAERASADILVGPQWAVFAVIGANIGNEGFEKNTRAAVGQIHRINPFVLQAAPAVSILRCSAGAGQIVLRIRAEDFQLLLSIRLADYGGHRSLVDRRPVYPGRFDFTPKPN